MVNKNNKVKVNLSLDQTVWHNFQKKMIDDQTVASTLVGEFMRKEVDGNGTKES
jgi:hypothetical protein